MTCCVNLASKVDNTFTVPIMCLIFATFWTRDMLPPWRIKKMQFLARVSFKDAFHSSQWWVLMIATMADQVVVCRDACQPTVSIINLPTHGISVRHHLHWTLLIHDVAHPRTWRRPYDECEGSLVQPGSCPFAQFETHDHVTAHRRAECVYNYTYVVLNPCTHTIIIQFGNYHSTNWSAATIVKKTILQKCIWKTCLTNFTKTNQI